jgi:superfamily II DNA or RNA helicase
MQRWPHQISTHRVTLAALDAGYRRICVALPTGMGKSVVLGDLADTYLDRSKKVLLLSNRRLLIEQLSRVMAQAGLDHGVRASGWGDDGAGLPFQISSCQTEHSRVYRKGTRHLHDADLVIIDECHLQTGAVARQILDTYLQEGASYVGFTATPLDLGGMYDHLIVGGTVTDGRKCNALVKAYHYGPDEPDLRKLKKLREGIDLTKKQQRQAMMTPTLWGRVSEWFAKLNPEQRPTILFAPGVRESIWFAERFCAAGIPAAHIDGQEVWINGKLERTSRAARDDVLAASRDGKIKVICNRFVLREGVDAPWLAHGIFACVFGSLSSYLQAGGRLLRAHSSLEYVIIQDHGGSWHRHGSLNADRNWSLNYTDAIAAGVRIERLRSKKELEPVRCPQCGMILAVTECFGCAYVIPVCHKRSRPVVTTDGKLVELSGDIYMARRICQHADAAKRWRPYYYASRRSKNRMTFNQAFAWFASENNWQYPPPDIPLMPIFEIDRFLPVCEVPMDRLTA